MKGLGADLFPEVGVLEVKTKRHRFSKYRNFVKNPDLQKHKVSNEKPKLII